MNNYQQYIKVVPDFPQKGINFLDITPLLLRADVFDGICEEIKNVVAEYNPDVIIAPESRGYLFGAPVAKELKKGLYMLRKSGKLPNDGSQITFAADKEYGTSEFAVNLNDFEFLKQQKLTDVVIIDDVLATGQTLLGIADFYRSHGFNVKAVITVINIAEVGGMGLLTDNGYKVHAIINV